MHGLRCITVAVLSALIGVAAGAQLPLGPDFQVNTDTTGRQEGSRVAATPDGGFLISWGDPGSGGDRLLARRFDDAGVPVGSEFRVDSGGFLFGTRSPSSILVDDDSEFTVIWGEVDDSAGCAFCISGRGRRLAADGTPLSSEFEIVPEAEYGFVPVGAGRPNGEFVVAANNGDPITLLRFDASGTVQGSFEILAPTNHGQGSPNLAAAPTGEFVVVWNDWEVGGYEIVADNIRFQAFAASGAPAGEPVVLTAPGTDGYRYRPRVARNATGTYLVVWEEELESRGPGGSWIRSIRARTYDFQGNALGPEFQVGDSTLGLHWLTRVASAPDGSFVVTWSDSVENDQGGDGSSSGIRARHLAADGAPTGPSFLVNSYTTGAQWGAAVTILTGGDFVITWTSDGSFGNDDSGASIQARRFRPALFADGFETGDLSRW